MGSKFFSVHCNSIFNYCANECISADSSVYSLVRLACPLMLGRQSYDNDEKEANNGIRSCSKALPIDDMSLYLTSWTRCEACIV